MKAYLVVRRYRTTERVLCLTTDEKRARDAYQSERSKLRDGDVKLYEITAMNKLASASGGYNRTRW